jgi:hypothetical protein
MFPAFAKASAGKMRCEGMKTEDVGLYQFCVNQPFQLAGQLLLMEIKQE